MSIDMCHGRYVLKDHTPVKEPSLYKWGRWFEGHNRRVERTMIEGTRVSTVFLGLDHNFGSEGSPLLFETMVFGEDKPFDQEMTRCSTWDEAVLMHHAMCERVRDYNRRAK